MFHFVFVMISNLNLSIHSMRTTHSLKTQNKQIDRKILRQLYCVSKYCHTNTFKAFFYLGQDSFFFVLKDRLRTKRAGRIKGGGGWRLKGVRYKHCNICSLVFGHRVFRTWQTTTSSSALLSSTTLETSLFKPFNWYEKVPYSKVNHHKHATCHVDVILNQRLSVF